MSKADSGLLGKLALVFISVSCSLPVLLMLHAPPHSGVETFNFPGQDPSSASKLRGQGTGFGLAERVALMRPPQHPPSGPLPPPPPPGASPAKPLVRQGPAPPAAPHAPARGAPAAPP
eukprot:CAMPEP_0172623204 /NCGR_PEP_ID=MMETSP1068-20121228/126641_1 /TAXON_ID=35684 /ORGANISM="Pseudopedinella elastica, Strain CCMP716" /LENGTH=117 /DNA_ID=CAMNT_0013431669 /DNA_START=41 /DNA_END=390 /DNA_ORIENTATION=+